MERDIGMTLAEKVSKQECGPKFKRLKSGSLYLLYYRPREDEMWPQQLFADHAETNLLCYVSSPDPSYRSCERKYMFGISGEAISCGLVSQAQPTDCIVGLVTWLYHNSYSMCAKILAQPIK